MVDVTRGSPEHRGIVGRTSPWGSRPTEPRRPSLSCYALHVVGPDRDQVGDSCRVGLCRHEWSVWYPLPSVSSGTPRQRPHFQCPYGCGWSEGDVDGPVKSTLTYVGRHGEGPDSGPPLVLSS